MEGAMLYRKFPAYNLNVSSAIPSDNLVRSMRSFTIPITTNFGLFSQMLKVTLETFSVRRVFAHPGNSTLFRQFVFRRGEHFSRTARASA